MNIFSIHEMFSSVCKLKWIRQAVNIVYEDYLNVFSNSKSGRSFWNTSNFLVAEIFMTMANFCPTNILQEFCSLKKHNMYIKW